MIIMPATGGMRPLARRHRRHLPGLAIVVTVSMIALLTLLILAFLLASATGRHSTSSDVSRRQADSIAGVARETIIADLLVEIRETSPDTPSGPGPRRSVKPSLKTADAFKLITKQSAAGIPFHNSVPEDPPDGGNGIIRASSVSTSAPAAGGRSIASSRWAAPRFFAPTAVLSEEQVPDWIYLTRDGSNPTELPATGASNLDATGNPSPGFILGRYAYQVYDVSGLLDANVAGYGSGAPAEDIALKGSLVWADLTALPGTSSSISGLPEWRHRGEWSGAFNNLVRPWGNPYGWMRTPRAAGSSDNRFLGRQDLLNFQKANPGVLTEDTLPYLTTASREINQPSWAPTADASSGFLYRTKRDNPSEANRRLLSVLVKAGFTRRDGTSAEPGEPLVMSRFPLSRIDAIALGDHEAVASWFGLVPARESSGEVIEWTYANYFNGNIGTLDQVAGANREPNFFELLKAGLLRGSIANRMTEDSFFKDTGRDNKEAYQILRIGASIIDQWDRDDNPTVIQYGLENPITGVRPDDVAGVENLPYFHFLGESRFRRRDTGEAPKDTRASTFITFQLWNPHLNATLGDVAQGDFRIAFAGKSRMEWHTFPSAGHFDPGFDPYIRNSAVRTATPEADHIQFKVSPGRDSFATPVYLHPGRAEVAASNPKDLFTTGSTSVIGYCVGEIDAPYTSTSLHSRRYSAHGLFSRYEIPMTFALQKKVGATWVSYQIIPEWSQTHGFVVAALQDNTGRLYAEDGKYVNLHAMLTDPRTTRYGLSTTTEGNLAIDKPTGNRTYDHRFSPPANWTKPSGRRPEEFQANSTSGSSTIVVDRDGIRRPADAGRPFMMPPERPMILNRPFRSVSEMGHAFRDDAWKTINFFGDPQNPKNPGDGALLDLFSLTEAPLRAGVINPNAAPVPVITALLRQASIREGVNLSPALAASYAAAIRKELDTLPLLTAADIPRITGKITHSITIPGIKNHNDRQVIARALADISNTRTWNLMIDVIAQSGLLTPGATGLENFAARSERRYWYHVSIDRFTGEIIDLQQEIVFE